MKVMMAVMVVMMKMMVVMMMSKVVVLIMVVMMVMGHTRTQACLPVKVRGQLCRVGSLLPPSHGLRMGLGSPGLCFTC